MLGGPTIESLVYHDAYHANVLPVFPCCLELVVATVARQLPVRQTCCIAASTGSFRNARRAYTMPLLLLKQLMWFLKICRRAPGRLPPRALGCGIILWYTQATTGSFFHFPAAFQISTRADLSLFQQQSLDTRTSRRIMYMQAGLRQAGPVTHP